MRRFEFEADIYDSLACVPMAVRNKLDRIRIKISLQQWQSLELSQRRRICEFPIDTEQQSRALSDLLHRLVVESCGDEPQILSLEQQQAAFPPLELPRNLAENARAVGYELNQETWNLLAEDERYVLMKLGGGRRIKRNFEDALKELFPGRSEADSLASLEADSPE